MTPTLDVLLPVTKRLKLFQIRPTVVVEGVANSSSVVVFFFCWESFVSLGGGGGAGVDDDENERFMEERMLFCGFGGSGLEDGNDGDDDGKAVELDLGGNGVCFLLERVKRFLIPDDNDGFGVTVMDERWLLLSGETIPGLVVGGFGKSSKDGIVLDFVEGHKRDIIEKEDDEGEDFVFCCLEVIGLPLPKKRYFVLSPDWLLRAVFLAVRISSGFAMGGVGGCFLDLENKIDRDKLDIGSLVLDWPEVDEWLFMDSMEDLVNIFFKESTVPCLGSNFGNRLDDKLVDEVLLLLLVSCLLFNWNKERKERTVPCWTELNKEEVRLLVEAASVCREDDEVRMEEELVRLES